MLTKDVPLPPSLLSVLVSEAENLNPPQEMAIKAGLLDGKNIVVSSPTASGKTMIAEMAFLKHFSKGGKTVYLVPLKALASEKYDEFKAKYEKAGMKIAISIGDMDTDDAWLKNYNLIIASNEKMDSLLRHRAAWIKDVTLVISDEVHLLDDASRGPTLEIVLTRLRSETRSQILALSATIKNAQELAEWLGATLVKSDYRPVKLKKGVHLDGKNYFGDGEVLIANGKEEFALCRDTLRAGKQALVFVSTRRSAEAEAEKIAKAVPSVSAELNALANSIEKALPVPTKQCRRLASVIRKGTAFHHAGLVAKQRRLVEDAFKSGKIKFITATPTLAFGVNLPAWRVIVRDTRRFTVHGMDYIPNTEVQQMFGRAGRPRYDKEGEALLLAKSDAERKEMEERYINGDMEDIYSKLAVEPVLRMHVLGLVASGFASSTEDLRSFFSKTLYAKQYGDMESMMEKISRVIKMLKGFSFFKDSAAKLGGFMPAFDLGDEKLEATLLGKRVAELYIDPVSANHLVKNAGSSALEHVMAINHCLEMRPMLRVKAREAEDIENLMETYDVTPPDAWDLDYEEFLDKFKTSLMFLDWMEERGEDALLDKYGIAPGELHSKKKNAGWLLYAARELAMLAGKESEAKELNKTRLRMHYGVKDELLRLVMIKGIGRVKARALFRAGVTKKADVKKLQPDELARLIGKRTAERVMTELNAQIVS